MTDETSRPKPRVSILSRAFKWRSSAATNVADTIAREKRRLAAIAKADAAERAEKVRPLIRKPKEVKP
jgi:hypothetical protein